MLIGEELLVNLLKPVGAAHNAKVTPLPEDYYKIEGQVHQLNHIWVCFDKQTIDKNSSRLFYSIKISSKKLRGHQSIYAIIDDVKLTLHNRLEAPFVKPIRVEQIAIDELEKSSSIWKATVLLSIETFEKQTCVIL